MQNGRSPTHLRPPGAANCILQMDLITHNLSVDYLPFIAANYMTNLIVIAERSHLHISELLLRKYPCQKMIDAA